MNNTIIIEFNQSTGLGDQYSSIYTVYNIYNKLKQNTNANILVYSNTENSFYFGSNPPGFDFYKEIFDYSFIDTNCLYFNTSIDSSFIFQKNWKNIFKLYTNNKNNVDIINNLNIIYYGHSELINSINSYNPLNINPLINKNLFKKISLPTNPFIVCYCRFPDGENINENLLIKIKDQIKKIAYKYKDYQILIGGRNNIFNEFKDNKNFIIHTECESSGCRKQDVINHAKDMIYMSYSNKIFKYCSWPSNFILYSILHNNNKKQYIDYIENLL